MEWVFARLGQLNEKLFAALAKTVELQVSDVLEQGAAHTAWTFTSPGQSDRKLLAKLA